MRIILEVRSNRIPDLVAAMRGRAEQVVAKTVMDIEAAAKSKAPVDTGNLMNSIQGTADGLSGEVATGVEYAVYQEYGTYKMAAHPFMTPAAEAVFPQFLGAMEQIVNG